MAAEFSSVSMRILSPDGKTVLAELQTIDRVANTTAGRVGRTTSRSIGDVEKSAVKGSLGLARVNNSMIQLMRTTTGATPIMGQLTDVIGTFAFGIGPMVGILAGITALAVGFQAMTRDAREAKEAARALTVELGKLTESGNIGSIGGRFGLATKLFSGNRFAVKGLDESGKEIDENDAAFLIRQRGILGGRAEIARWQKFFDEVEGSGAIAQSQRQLALDNIRALTRELDKVTKRYEGLIGLVRELEAGEGTAAAARLASLREGKGAESSKLEKLLRDATGATDIGNLRFADGLKSGGFFNPAEQWQQVAEMMREGLKKTPPLPNNFTPAEAEDFAEILRLDSVAAGIAASFAGALVGGITDGIVAAVSGGGLADGFAALTGAVLVGLGHMAIRIGTESAAFLSLMQVIENAIANFLPGMGLAGAFGLIGLGSLLVAAGGVLGGRGRGSLGRSSGFGGGGFGGTGQTIIDRGLINPLNGVVTAPGVITPRSAVNLTALIYGSPNDPVMQRHFLEVVDKANARRGS